MKKIFKTIGLICMAVVVAVGSIFVTKKQTQNEINVASASTSVNIPTLDNTYSSSYKMHSTPISNLNFFTSDSFSFPYLGFCYSSFDYFPSSFTNYLLCYLDFGFSLYQSSSSYTINFYLSGYSLYSDTCIFPIGCCKSYPNSDYLTYSSDYMFGIYSTTYNSSSCEFSSSLYSPLLFYCSSQDIFIPFYCFVDYTSDYSTDSIPSLNMTYYSFIISSSSFCSSYSDDVISFLNTNYGQYYICSFVDTAGFRYNLAFPIFYSGSLNSNYSDSLFIESRYYSISSFSDDFKYNKGYSDGLADNQQNIYNQGYLAGRIIGYGEGHTDGVNDSNTYTFTGLIGAVIDVPVKTILGLLDFEILGVNLFGFAVGLISFSVLLFIIRKIKGGRWYEKT